MENPGTQRDLMNAVPPPEVWTSDFVIRSLRRRLWKAFQEDDGVTALRAYQASLSHFEGWLREEQEEYCRIRDDMETTSKSGSSKRGSFFKRRSSKDADRMARSIREMNSSNGSGAFVLDKLVCKTEKDPEMVQIVSSDSAKPATDLQHLNKGPILQSHINPSEPFIADDFLSPYESYSMPAQKMLPDPQKREREKELRKRRSRGPRLAAFNIFKRDLDPAADTEFEETDSEPMFRLDPTMTTPLHEAARLGSGDFLRILLANGGDPNVKNGNSRTSLHMCSGGVTREEETLIAAGVKKKKKASSKTTPNGNDDNDRAGLKAPAIPSDVLALMNADLRKATDQKGKARKAAKKVGKMINSALRSSTKDTSQTEPTRQNPKRKMKANPSRLGQISTERMDAVLALLSWVQSETGDGPSLNAVDADGRTALHYAAEMGRTEVCMAILSNFGAMLTVVDEIGSRTPCELAAHRGHDDLAAQLEARALLYIDPYGLDDELMATVLTSEMANDQDEWNPRSQLSAPFTWFSTATPSQVAEERTKRLADGTARIKKAIALWEGARDMKSIMAKAAKVGLDAAIDENNGEEVPSAADVPPADGGSMSAVMASAEKFGLDVALGRKPLEAAEDKEPGSDDNNGADKVEEKDVATLSVEDERRTLESIKEVHVERYLSYHKWNLADALKQFRKKPTESLKKAGIVLSVPESPETEKPEERMCLICYDDEVEEENWVDMKWCGHGFCSSCLEDYLKDCAASKSPVATIKCPHHECEAGIPQSAIEEILSEHPEDLARIVEANTEKFVASSEDYKFCTHPGCQGIVKRIPQPFLVSNGIDLNFMNYTGAVCVGVQSEESSVGGGFTLTYEGVDDPEYNNCRSERQPRRAHRFCFACGEGRHWPVTCERLEEWKQKMREQIKEVEGEGDEENDVNDVAQRLWMKANTRPCPECKVPIEKNDGCNHMTCTNPNCRHEFCWICRKDWKLHGTATGGFFRCNIWQEDGDGPPDGERSRELTPQEVSDPDSVNDQGYGTAIYSSREQWRERQEMARFLHHYTRWEAHGDSATLERKMGDSACARLAPVVEAATDFDGSPTFNFGGKGLSFVHSAFMELQECRSVLKHSYAFSFFRYPAFCQVRRYGQLSSRRREKMTFESLQSELEMMTEQMSDVVARSHLRATQVQIMFLTATTAEKREEFSNLMFSILNDEKKEAKKAKHAKSSDMTESRSSRRYRNPYSMSSPLGSLGRVVDDSWNSDADQIADNELRTTLEEFMARAVPLDPPERNDVATRMWACSACTYMNSGGNRCAICGGLRSA